jgi:hypothetical protein
MTLFKLLGTTLLATLLLTSSACSTNSGVKDSPLHCPETGLEKRPDKDIGEIPQDWQGFKKKFAEVVGKYRVLHEQDSTLLNCWHREAEKRKQ